MSDKDDWPTSYYSELLLDTLLENLSPTEGKDLDVWYGRHEVQVQEHDAVGGCQQGRRLIWNP